MTCDGLVSHVMGGKSYTQISVTEDDIAKAFVNNSAKCVVAQAIARTIPDSTRIEVDVQTIRYTGGDGRRHVFLTPYAVVGYVIAFDAGDEIEPFTFRLWHEREMTTKRQTRTAAGKKRDTANSKVRRTREKRAAAAAATEVPDLTPTQSRLAHAELAMADEEVAAAEDRQERVRHETAGEPLVVDSEGERPRPRRVKAYKTNVRHYGHRVMRQNQAAP